MAHDECHIKSTGALQAASILLDTVDMVGGVESPALWRAMAETWRAYVVRQCPYHKPAGSDGSAGPARPSKPSKARWQAKEGPASEGGVRSCLTARSNRVQLCLPGSDRARRPGIGTYDARPSPCPARRRAGSPCCILHSKLTGSGPSRRAYDVPEAQSWVRSAVHAVGRAEGGFGSARTAEVTSGQGVRREDATDANVCLFVSGSSGSNRAAGQPSMPCIVVLMQLNN